MFRDTPLGILQDMLTLPGLRPDGQLPWSATYGTSHNTAVKAALGNKGVVVGAWGWGGVAQGRGVCGCG